MTTHVGFFALRGVFAFVKPARKQRESRVMASEQTVFGFRNSQRYDLFIGKEAAILSCLRKRKTLLFSFFLLNTLVKGQIGSCKAVSPRCKHWCFEVHPSAFYRICLGLASQNASPVTLKFHSQPLV